MTRSEAIVDKIKSIREKLREQDESLAELQTLHEVAGATGVRPEDMVGFWFDGKHYENERKKAPLVRVETPMGDRMVSDYPEACVETHLNAMRDTDGEEHYFLPILNPRRHQ